MDGFKLNEREEIAVENKGLKKVIRDLKTIHHHVTSPQNHLQEKINEKNIRRINGMVREGDGHMFSTKEMESIIEESNIISNVQNVSNQDSATTKK